MGPLTKEKKKIVFENVFEVLPYLRAVSAGVGFRYPETQETSPRSGPVTRGWGGGGVEVGRSLTVYRCSWGRAGTWGL